MSSIALNTITKGKITNNQPRLTEDSVVMGLWLNRNQPDLLSGFNFTEYISPQFDLNLDVLISIIISHVNRDKFIIL